MRRDTSKPLRAGDLSHRVSIVAPAGVAAADESTIETGVQAAITVTPVAFQSKEGIAVGGIQVSTVYTVSVRYRTDLRPDYRIDEECHTGRRFQIQAMAPSDLGDAIDMTCVTAN